MDIYHKADYMAAGSGGSAQPSVHVISLMPSVIRRDCACCGVQSDGTSDEMKREQMEKLVREELERWDSETSVPQSARGASPSDSSGRNVRSRSRPNSGQNAGVGIF